jgi:hypothetical protein
MTRPRDTIAAKLAAPNLLNAEASYNQALQGQHRNVLRLFFNQIANSVNSIITWRDDNHNWMAGWDTDVQTIADATQAYVIAFTDIDPNSVGFTVDTTSTVTTPVDGIYTLQFSLQLTNSDSQAHYAYAWVRVNGTDFPDSTTTITVPSKHGSLNGAAVLTVIITFYLQRGDRVQLMWGAETTDVSLETLPIGSSPTRPLSPSAIASIFQVA